MASESESESAAAAAPRYVGSLVTYRNGDMTLFIPLLLNNSNGSDESATSPSNRNYSVLGAAADLDAFFADFQTQAAGPPPASEASIVALPEVENGDGDDCAICLDGMKVAKVMPCKHMFHGGCVEKWLRSHGSCPVCRYPMPAEQEEHNDDNSGSNRMRVIWVPISVETRSLNQETDQQTE